MRASLSTERIRPCVRKCNRLLDEVDKEEESRGQDLLGLAVQFPEPVAP